MLQNMKPLMECFKFDACTTQYTKQHLQLIMMQKRAFVLISPVQALEHI